MKIKNHEGQGDFMEDLFPVVLNSDMAPCILIADRADALGLAVSAIADSRRLGGLLQQQANADVHSRYGLKGVQSVFNASQQKLLRQQAAAKVAFAEAWGLQQVLDGPGLSTQEVEAAKDAIRKDYQLFIGRITVSNGYKKMRGQLSKQASPKRRSRAA